MAWRGGEEAASCRTAPLQPVGTYTARMPKAGCRLLTHPRPTIGRTRHRAKDTGPCPQRLSQGYPAEASRMAAVAALWRRRTSSFPLRHRCRDRPGPGRGGGRKAEGLLCQHSPQIPLQTQSSCSRATEQAPQPPSGTSHHSGHVPGHCLGWGEDRGQQGGGGGEHQPSPTPLPLHCRASLPGCPLPCGFAAQPPGVLLASPRFPSHTSPLLFLGFWSVFVPLGAIQSIWK